MRVHAFDDAGRSTHPLVFVTNFSIAEFLMHGLLEDCEEKFKQKPDVLNTAEGGNDPNL